MKKQQSNADIRRLINSFYFAVAALIAATLPVAYFVEDFYGEQQEVEAWAEKQAIVVNNEIEKNPHIWPADAKALHSLLAQTVTDDDDETVHRITDLQRNVLTGFPYDYFPGFAFTAEAPLFRSSTLIGSYQVERSVEGLLLETLYVAIGGMLFALIIIFPLRILSLRALQSVLNSLEEEKEKALITLRSIGDAVIATDANMRIEYLNPVAQAMSGWSNDEARGRIVYEVLSLNDHDSSKSAIDYISLFLADQPVHSMKHHSILRRRTDGQEFFIESSIAPIRNLQGIMTGAVMVFHDVTERNRVEQQLRESQMRAENALSIAQLGTFEWNQDTDRIECSARTREIFEFTGDEGHARFNYFDVIVPSDRKRVMDELKASLKSDGRLSTEYRVQLRNGGIRHIVSMSTAQKDQQGVWVRRVGVFSDITDRKNTEERLKEADRHKDEFLAMLAHELRNPLAPISAAAEILRHISGPGQDYVKQVSEIIERQVDHMTGLVNDLLDVSRVTTGAIRLDKSSVNMAKVVAAAVEQVTPLIEARHHYFELFVSPESVHVFGDKKRLIQVVANILNNAAKYTPEGGQIKLELTAQEGQAVVCVTDNGIGIPPNLIHRVFELFTQAERTPDRSSGGLGLGLALVKNLVELHGGKVICLSEGHGKGSTFKLWLPRLLGLEQSTGPEKQREIAQKLRDTALKILVVDDNVDAARTLARLLEILGHQATVEHDALHVLERVQTDLPDVCMLDIGLPGMDGIELGNKLKNQPETAGIRLVAVSGYSQQKEREQALSVGFEAYFVKPVNVEKLTELLH